MSFRPDLPYTYNYNLNSMPRLFTKLRKYCDHKHMLQMQINAEIYFKSINKNIVFSNFHSLM